VSTSAPPVPRRPGRARPKPAQHRIPGHRPGSGAASCRRLVV